MFQINIKIVGYFNNHLNDAIMRLFEIRTKLLLMILSLIKITTSNIHNIQTEHKKKTYILYSMATKHN